MTARQPAGNRRRQSDSSRMRCLRCRAASGSSAGSSMVSVSSSCDRSCACRRDDVMALWRVIARSQVENVDLASNEPGWRQTSKKTSFTTSSASDRSLMMECETEDTYFVPREQNPQGGLLAGGHQPQQRF